MLFGVDFSADRSCHSLASAVVVCVCVFLECWYILAKCLNWLRFSYDDYQRGHLPCIRGPGVVHEKGDLFPEMTWKVFCCDIISLFIPEIVTQVGKLASLV